MRHRLQGRYNNCQAVGADIIRPFAPATAGPVGRDKVNCPNGAREGALGYDSARPMGPPRRPNKVVGVGRRRPSE